MHAVPRRLAWPATLACVLSVAGSFAASAGTPAGHYAAGLVDAASYEHILRDTLFTHLGDDKSKGGPDHDPCRESILAQFEAAGLTATLHPFATALGTCHNIVAELAGTTKAEDVFIVGAHYDSWYTPGADDDASGVAGLLEIARIIGRREAAATIRLVAFDVEECGLWGSEAYVEELAGVPLAGMVQLDMIAFRGGAGPVARVFGHDESGALKQAVAAALLDYAGVAVTDSGAKDASNHAPFELAGYAACLLQEYNMKSNPHYHKATDSVDTPGYIDYGYASMLTRGLLGWLVDAAGVRPDYPLGDMDGSYQVDAFDIDPFVLALTDPAQYVAQFPDIDPNETGDINGDGVLNAFDIDPFVALLSG